MTNLAYLPGVFTLHHALTARHKSAYPLLVLYADVLPAAGLAAIQARGIPCRPVPFLSPGSQADRFVSDVRFNDCWTKLTVFSLYEYDRVVLLDSDMLVMQNMDELMNTPLDAAPSPSTTTGASDGPPGRLSNVGARVIATGHACVCNPLAKPHYPAEWTPANCAFTSQHDTPDVAQTEPPAVSALNCLNSGLIVVSPSPVYYAHVIAHLAYAKPSELPFSDQSLIERAFAGSWAPLPYVYNALKTLRWPGVHDKIWRDDRVKNIHYILSPKPWDEIGEDGEWTGKEESHKWWFDANVERKAAEQSRGVPADGF